MAGTDKDKLSHFQGRSIPDVWDAVQQYGLLTVQIFQQRPDGVRKCSGVPEPLDAQALFEPLLFCIPIDCFAVGVR